ncbi:MAG TPA: glycoside hydrolase family 3 N-terminal domain-containing protein [Vicinamibacteria bacterium]|nr:glycoside hydrolase family 3 N-terminal domain-containing protein [Vicinamibacteria bacterium]
MKALAGGAIGLALLAVLPALAQDTAVYRDRSRPVDERVRDLLARMTLDEKVAQTLALWKGKEKITDAQGQLDPAGARTLLANGLGQLSRPTELRDKPTKILLGPREDAVFINAVQKWLVENTRLGIPVLTHEEALHGLVAPKGTNFPIPIALASTWDPALVEKVMSIAALEARARGTHEVLSPVLDLARDPRWGRTEETYGEDPYLVSRLGVAAIRGYQGTSRTLAKDKVFATAKHFAGHGPHEGGINTAPTAFAERLLRDQYLFPFEAAISETPVLAVMPSYNEMDGVPSHKNRWLLGRVLRQEWGFDGMVVSDYYAIDQMVSQHGVAADLADAARQAIEAGVDVELPDIAAYAKLADLVKDGRLSESVLDRAVARILRAKFLAGLFEDPYVDPDRAQRVSNTPEHQAVALEAARRAMVLLKNDGALLPLDRAKLKTIAVIGPNAKGVRLGGYSSEPGRGVDILDGIKQKVGTSLRVLYAEGVRITEEPPNWTADKVVFGDPVKNRQRIAEAVTIARQADVAVVVIGTNESTSREAWADNHLGDVADLELSSQQNELVDAVRGTGKPVVVVLINGRPLALSHVAQTVPAILEGFYLGQEGGTAVADVLFGDVSPGGKLPISFPRATGQLPVYYDRKPTSFRSYLDLTREPLFTFGYGLSYTTFKLDNLKVTPEKIGPAGEATVTVDVTNTGARAGDEVVQLYVRDRVASVTRPVKELRGFERVGLAPGERKTVTFKVGPAALRFTNERMERVVEPGLFDLMVGTSSKTAATAPLEVVERRTP